MNEQQVVELMKSSRSESDWNANCNKVKAACGGCYPSFWYTAIIKSGIAAEVMIIDLATRWRKETKQ